MYQLSTFAPRIPASGEWTEKLCEAIYSVEYLSAHARWGNISNTRFQRGIHHV